MTTTPRTWVVGEVVTAALLNVEIRDQFASFFGAWSTYTVTWSATTTNPTIGNGTLLGRYMKIGRTVHGHIDLICGSTTTYGSGTYSFSLPAAAAASGTGSRVTTAQALGANRFGGSGIISPTATDSTPFFPSGTGVSNLTACSPSVPFAWASTNQLRNTFTYETAS